ncbi:MAG: hypothetical protein HY747_03430 [Elusimicrobia bacterium]|nr:hypothetical protein [Elusimicrobiota bacterium]
MAYRHPIRKIIPYIVAAAAAGALYMIFWPKIQSFRIYILEGRTKGSLSELRRAVNFYYQRNGKYPASLENFFPGENLGLKKLPVLWDAKYLRLPHPPTSEVVHVSGPKLTDSGRWAYVDNPMSPYWGKVYIDCIHRDSRGSPWVSY